MQKPTMEREDSWVHDISGGQGMVFVGEEFWKQNQFLGFDLDHVNFKEVQRHFTMNFVSMLRLR